MAMIIYFGGKPIPHYSRIPYDLAQQDFEFEYKFTYPRVYTLTMYDRNDHILHYFRSGGKVLFDYIAPNKPEHTYTVELYESDPKDVIQAPTNRDNFYGGNYGVMVGNAEFTLNGGKNSPTSSLKNLTLEDNIVYHGPGRFIHPVPSQKGTGYPLNEKQQKYCSCMLHVLAKGGVDNVNAVCAKSIGTTYRDCWRYYAWARLPIDELIAYAEKHGVKVSQNREKMLENIYEWIASKP